MKKLFTILALVALAPLSQAFDHSGLDQVLKKYVNNVGLVDYSALEKDRDGLDSYLASTGAVDEATFDSWSESEQIAFLTNIYNAETLQLIIDNLPVETIKDLGGLFSTPWDKKVVTLFGKEITLNKVEHDILRKDYDEPRLHFALVCAAISCPPLRTEAYTAAKLDRQLDDQGKVFLNQEEKNRIEGDTLYLSKIFDWYGKDFEKGENTVANSVDQYLSGSTAGKEIEYTEYDWSLNAQ